MGATAHTIWRVPAYLPDLQPPLTDEAVAAAEKTIGFRLPSAYLSLLQVQNGGCIRYALPDNVHSQINGIGPHFPSLTGFNWDYCRKYVSYDLDGLIPFDGDYCHWYLCFDYRSGTSNPAVTYIDVECDEQFEVAESFANYLALLELDVDECDFVILAVSDIEEVKSSIASTLKITFEPPDLWSHGYPEHRARGGSEEKPEWIWISPNVVPRGFVPKDDKRYDELHDLLPGEAPRFPQLPEPSFLLRLTGGWRSRVLDACRQISIDIRPLIECAT